MIFSNALLRVYHIPVVNTICASSFSPISIFEVPYLYWIGVRWVILGKTGPFPSPVKKSLITAPIVFLIPAILL